ncbi:MAG TPA: histidinol dehydrogenase [Acidisarcina sp.]
MKLARTTGRGAKETERLLVQLERRGERSSADVLPVVRRIVDGVRQGGDEALRRYSTRLDGLSAQSLLRIRREEMQRAWDATPAALRNALEAAASNIREFARRQLPVEWSFSPLPGLNTGQVIRPLEAVGCYVPGGRYPLPSTMLMTVIPAQVAGVRRIAVCSPRPAPETLAAAWLLGVTEFYQIGGAQAIAALAYGTESIARVDKIVGPGNAFVTTAKTLVAFDCGIDMLAGPTEIVVTSETGDPAAIASDLVAQAEHDPQALALLVTTQDLLATAVIAEVKQRVKLNAIAKEAIRNSGYAVIASSVEEAHEITNRLAPEHLTVDAQEDVTWVRNAGSVFAGRYSPQPMGDYISGPNHTLPTGGLARVRGGLSVNDFVKVITVQHYGAAALRTLAPAAITLAEAEGLHGHAEAIRMRAAHA